MSITNTNTAFQETNLQNISNNTNDTSVNLQATTGLDAQNVNSRNSLNNIDSTSISRTVQQQQIAQMAIAHIVRDIDKCEAEIAAIKSPKGLQKFINVLQTIFNLIDSTIKTPTQRIAELRANVQNKLQQLNEYNVIWQSCYISQSASQSSGTSPIQTQDTNSEVQADEVTPNAEEAQSLAQQAVQDTRELHQKNLPEPFLREANKQTLTLIFGKLDEKASAFTDASTSINEPHQRQAAMVGDTGVPPPPPPPPPPPGAVGSATVSSNGASTNSANASNAHNALEENFDNDLKAFQELQSKGKTVEFSFSYRGLQGNEVARKLASRSIHNKGELTAYQQDLSKSVDRLNGEIDSLKKPIDELKNKIQAAINDCLSNTTTVKQVVCGKSIDCTLSFDEGQKNLYGSNPLAFFNDLELLKMQGLINDTQYQTLSDLRDQKLTNGTQTDFQNRLDSIKSINDAIAQLKNESNASATLLPKCKTGMDQQIAEFVEQRSKLPDKLSAYWLDFSYKSLLGDVDKIKASNQAKIDNLRRQITTEQDKLLSDNALTNLKNTLEDKGVSDDEIQGAISDHRADLILQIRFVRDKEILSNISTLKQHLIRKDKISSLEKQVQTLQTTIDITSLLVQRNAQMSVENNLLTLANNLEDYQKAYNEIANDKRLQPFEQKEKNKASTYTVVNKERFNELAKALNKIIEGTGFPLLDVSSNFKDSFQFVEQQLDFAKSLQDKVGQNLAQEIHNLAQAALPNIPQEMKRLNIVQRNLAKQIISGNPIKTNENTNNTTTGWGNVKIAKKTNQQQVQGNQQAPAAQQGFGGKLRSISNTEEQNKMQILENKVAPKITSFLQELSTAKIDAGELYGATLQHNNNNAPSEQYKYENTLKRIQKAQGDISASNDMAFVQGQKFTEMFGIEFCKIDDNGYFTYTDAYTTALSCVRSPSIAKTISYSSAATQAFIDALSKENADQQASASAQNQGNNVSA